VTFSAERGALDEASAELERQRTHLSSHQDSLASDRETLAAERAALAAEREALVSERQMLASKEAALESDRQRIRDTDAMVQTRSQELEAIKAALASERKAVDEVRTKIDEERTDLERARQEVEYARLELEAARDALDKEEDQLHAERETHANETTSQSRSAGREPMIFEGELVDAEGGPIAPRPLDGAWRLVAIEAFGREIPALSIRQTAIFWEFDGSRLVHQPEIGRRRESSFQLDPTTTPPRIAVTPIGGRPKYGIYALENERLKIAMFKDKDQLPTGFATRAGDGLRILIFSREAT
jgi:uncharacterized protein (TIGR03067 family)